MDVRFNCIGSNSIESIKMSLMFITACGRHLLDLFRPIKGNRRNRFGIESSLKLFYIKTMKILFKKSKIYFKQIINVVLLDHFLSNN